MPPTLARLVATLVLVASMATCAAAQVGFKPTFSLGGEGAPPFGQRVADSEPVTLSAILAPETEQHPAALVIRATIAPGYHIYSTTQPAGGPGPTVIEVAPNEAFRLTRPFVASPAPKTHIDQIVWEGLRIEEHTGRVSWVAPVEIADGVDPQVLTIRGTVSMQACQATTCEPLNFDFETTPGSVGPQLAALLPSEEPTAATGQGQSATVETELETPIELEPPAETSLFLILGAALLGGLILNLMPCVLPVIGLKVLSFAEQGGESRGKVLALNLAYSAGLIGVFMLLAALASLTQIGLSGETLDTLGLPSENLGWGELYTYNEFKIGMIVLVFAMALSFLGVWEIPIPGFAGTGKANNLQAQEGLSGAFFKGVFTTVLATPCSGPFLGPVFGYTISQPPSTTFLIFLFVGLGMASPYLLIGAFPGLVRWLPKPGAWMETFKQLMGFVLLGTVVYLLSTVSRDLYLPMLTTLVAVGVACWWIGRTPLTASWAQRSMSWVGGTAVAVATGFVAFSMIVPSDQELPWREYSQASLAIAQEEGKTVLVDFTADWCLTCKLNLKRAINTEKVKDVVEENDIVPLIADWTDRNNDIKQTLADLGSRSIPLLAIYPADRPEEPILLRDLITEQQLLDALRSAGALRGNGDSVDMPMIEIGGADGEGGYR